MVWEDVTRVRKKRKPVRAVRFADVKVGDQLVVRFNNYDDTVRDWFYQVTHIWFDPVAGFRAEGEPDQEAGIMVAIQRINSMGIPYGRPDKHTRRGLASQKYHYAKIDYIGMCKARLEGLNAGSVVGIGAAKRIKKHPSLSKPL